MMKPYAVDVPVAINIWVRPECQKKQFEVIREARPSVLFVTSDGGRNEREWTIIRQNRKLYEDGIDWDCKVYYLYEDKNNGMFAMGRLRRQFIWSKVDRCIFLEDDQIPSVSFFRFCAEMLEKYKDDLRISMVCGMNHLGVYEDVNSDYFFSRAGSIWGFAMWRRTCEGYGDFSYGKDPYVMERLRDATKGQKDVWKQFEAFARNTNYEGRPAGDEFFLAMNAYGQSQLLIVPKYNMISNIGSTGDAAHAGELRTLPHGIRRVFNMKTYELQFPLKHPGYVIEDKAYEKKINRIMGYGHPLVQAWRKIERSFLVLRYQGGKVVLAKMKNATKRARSGARLEK